MWKQAIEDLKGWNVSYIHTQQIKECDRISSETLTPEPQKGFTLWTQQTRAYYRKIERRKKKERKKERKKKERKERKKERKKRKRRELTEWKIEMVMHTAVFIHVSQRVCINRTSAQILSTWRFVQLFLLEIVCISNDMAHTRTTPLLQSNFHPIVGLGVNHN